MTRTTPPRPVDVAAVLPSLAPLARTATRLHPRPGLPSAHDSSVGGPLLWPADQPWPYCDGPHVDARKRPKPATSPTDVRLQRRIEAAALSRPHTYPYFPEYTPEESAILDRIKVGQPWPEGPVAMLPVAQLYARDMPLPCPPGPADLLQVLWCPFDHSPLKPYPRTALFWRSAAAVTNILADPPKTAAAQHWSYVPEPCLLHPEQVTEYPNFMDLSQDLQELVEQWCRRQAEGTGPGSTYTIDPKMFYWDELSVAPGWKAGGWPSWGVTDPIPQFCPACGTRMDPLLTIASTEWDNNKRSWIPYEDQAHTEQTGTRLGPADPAMIRIADNYNLQLYACPAFPDHPHTELVQ
jgi:hypothetical protein